MEIVKGRAREDAADNGGAADGGKRRGSRRQETKPITAMEPAGGGLGRTVGSADDDVPPLPRSDISAEGGSSRTAMMRDRAPL